MIELERYQDIEGGLVKYALQSKDENIVATLVYLTKYADEMEIRITINQDRFGIGGHKSIMDKFSFDEFKRLVIKHIESHEVLCSK